MAIGLVGVPAVLISVVSRGSWQGSTQAHTLIEVVAAMMALMVAVVALAKYFSEPKNTTLLIALGFLGTAFLDAYHALVTSSTFSVLFPSSPPFLIVWSWNASPIFLATVLLWWALARREGPKAVSGRSFSRVLFGVLGMLRRADGSNFPAEIRTSFVADGAMEFISASARNITERVEAQAEIAMMKERLERALSGASVGLWDWNLVSGAVYVPRTVGAAGGRA